MSAQGYTHMLEKYRDVDEDEIMSGLSKDELARLENEIDREILEKTPTYESCESESYTTATTTTDESEPEELKEEDEEEDEEGRQPEPIPQTSDRGEPEAFAKGKFDKTQIMPNRKVLQRQKSKDKHMFKLPALKKTVGPKSDKIVAGEVGNNDLKDELIQAVKKRDIKRRTKRVNSSLLGRRLSCGVPRQRRNSRIARYRDGNEHQVDAAVVNRNFITDEMLNLRPKLRKVHVKEPPLVLPEELHGVSFNRITAGATRKDDEEEDADEQMEAEPPESAISEPAISEDGDASHASRSSAFGYDADIDVTPSEDSYALPGEDYEMEEDRQHHKAMSESSESPSDGVAMASTTSTSAESCDIFGELSINPNSVEEMVERVRENDPTLAEVNLNNIHDVPMERFLELAEAMEDNTHVTSLMLANTGLTDRAAKAFATMLKRNSTLKKLNIESNFITGEGGRRIVSALRKNKCLIELSLNNQRNIFGAKVEHEMSRMLRENSSLLKFGYQFANAGPRMATSNILTKNIDLVRKKRVAEEKKRQHGGQFKRPQLRRQPSSEWYKKERLKKFQETSKVLGLDAGAGRDKEVEKVLKNMTPDEVSLLERWFSSKLLGMVDGPLPTKQNESEPEQNPADKESHSKTLKNADIKRNEISKGVKTKPPSENPDENLLRPPVRARRSRSPPANRNQLLDSIRKQNTKLKKVKLRPFESPSRLGHTDSDVEIVPLPNNKQSKSRTKSSETNKDNELLAKKEVAHAHKQKTEAKIKPPQVEPKSPEVQSNSPDVKPKSLAVRTREDKWTPGRTKKDVSPSYEPVSPKPAYRQPNFINASFGKPKRPKPKVSVARFGVSVKDKIAAAEKESKQPIPRTRTVPRTPMPQPHEIRLESPLEKCSQSANAKVFNSSLEKEKKATPHVKPTIMTTEPSFDESPESRCITNKTPELSSSEEMFTARDAETASYNSGEGNRAGSSRRRSPSPEVREWKGEEYDSDEYEVVEIEVTDSEEGESEEHDKQNSATQMEVERAGSPVQTRSRESPKQVECRKQPDDAKSPQSMKRDGRNSASPTPAFGRENDTSSSIYKSPLSARLGRNRPPPFTKALNSHSPQFPGQLRHGYGEEPKSQTAFDDRIGNRSASPNSLMSPTGSRRSNPLSPPSPQDTNRFPAYNRSLSRSSTTSTDSAKSSPVYTRPTAPRSSRPARSRPAEDEVQINPKALLTIESFFSFK